MRKQRTLLIVSLCAVLMIANANTLLCALNPVYTEGTGPVGSPNGKWWVVMDHDDNGNLVCVVGRNCFGEIHCSTCPPTLHSKGSGRYRNIIGQVPPGTHAEFAVGTGDVLWTVVEYDASNVEVCRVTKYTDGTVTTTCSAPESMIQDPLRPKEGNDGLEALPEQQQELSDARSQRFNNIIGTVKPSIQLHPSDILGTVDSSSAQSNNNIIGTPQQ